MIESSDCVMKGIETNVGQNATTDFIGYCKSALSTRIWATKKRCFPRLQLRLLPEVRLYVNVSLCIGTLVSNTKEGAPGTLAKWMIFGSNAQQIWSREGSACTAPRQAKIRKIYVNRRVTRHS